MKKKIWFGLLFVSPLLLSNCNSSHDKLPGLGNEEMDSLCFEAEELSEEVMSMEGSEESKRKLQGAINMREQLERVMSPVMLAQFKSDYNVRKFVSAIHNTSCPAEELDTLIKATDGVEKLYADKCKEYELPPEDVELTLRNLQRKVEQIDSKRKWATFLDTHRSVIVSLDIVHLQLKDNSSDSEKIKRLAEQLKRSIREKEEKYR